MANEYKIKLEVRGRSDEFGADNVTELLMRLASSLFILDRLASPVNIQNDANTPAQKLLKEYYVRFDKMDNRSDTLIFRAGKDIDLARCYLARMTVEEAVKWLGKERKFKASMSAVGRYWQKFAQLPTAVKIA